MLTLLSLPPELIGQILYFLSPEDIVTCSTVNSQLRVLIASSVGLQYTLALDAVRAEDNPLCIDSIASKLQALKNSENAWKFLDTKQRRKVRVTYLQSGVYDLSSGIYLLSDHGRRRLYTIDLNSLTPNTPQARRKADEEQQRAASGDVKTTTNNQQLKEEIIKWKKVESQKFIVDLGLCVYEHDLIALVTTEPRPRQAGQSQKYEIAIDIRQLSTDTPHPRAKSPTLHVLNSDYEKPAIGMEIVGQHLVLILCFSHQPDMPQDRVYIFQWMDGVLKASFEAKHRSYSGLLFLDTSLICLPNTFSKSLDIFRIPEAPTLESLKPIVRLSLPKLADRRAVAMISCRAEPNPVHPDSFAEMRAHSAFMRSKASNAMFDTRWAASSSSTSAPPGSEAPGKDEPNVTHDASKIALGQVFQRATVAASEHALCLFELHIFGPQLVMIPGGALNVNIHFQHRVAFVSPRSAILAAVAEHEARLQEEDRIKEEKKRLVAVAKAQKEKERMEREKDTEDRKRKRAMEAGPSRARANSPSVEEFVRQRERDADGGDDTGRAGSLFGRKDWPPADVEVDDDQDDKPYVPFGEGQREGQQDAEVAMSHVTAARTDLAGPSGETSTVVGTGNVQPDSVDETTPGQPQAQQTLTGQWPEIGSPYVYISPVYTINTNNGAQNDADMDAEMPELQDLSDSDDGEDDDDDGVPNIGGFGLNGGRYGRLDRTLVPWNDWNANRTRWFNSNNHVTHWITTSAGERLVRMADHVHGGMEEGPTDSEEEYHTDGGATNGSAAEAKTAGDGDTDYDDQSDSDLEGHPRIHVGAPFSVLDFNPRRVAAMRQWVEQQEKPVVRGLKRPATREEQDEEDEGEKERRDRAYVASDGEVPTLGVRADGSRRRQRNVRRAGKGSDKGKGKAKEADWALEQRKKREREYHVVGVWKVHPSKRDRKGKGKEKQVPVPEYITADTEEVLVSEPDPEPVLSTGYAIAIDDESPEHGAQDTTLMGSNLTDAEAAEFLDLLADAPETNAETDAAAQAIDQYLAQFDDDDDVDYSADQEAEEEDEMDVEGDFMDFIEQQEDEQDEDEYDVINAQNFYESEDSDESGGANDSPHGGDSVYPLPSWYIPRGGNTRREVLASRFLSTGGHAPAKPVLARPPPDSLWVVPGGDVFEAEQVFGEPIINGLPYVLSTSRNRYTYDGIMLDEDRVIGTKANGETHRIESIDLHYFA